MRREQYTYTWVQRKNDHVWNARRSDHPSDEELLEAQIVARRAIAAGMWSAVCGCCKAEYCIPSEALCIRTHGWGLCCNEFMQGKAEDFYVRRMPTAQEAAKRDDYDRAPADDAVLIAYALEALRGPRE